MGPLEKIVREKLAQEFKPMHLEVINESPMHSVPEGAESHFKVIIVSPKFESKKLIERHRSVQQCLSSELKDAIHALSIHALTTSEWESQKVPPSPACASKLS